MNSNNLIKGVIFDWAGTTVDFGCMAPAGVFIKVFKMKNIKITMEEARTPMGMHKKDHIREITKMERVKNLWYQEYKRECNENDINELFKEFIPLQMEIISNYSELIPETVDTQNYLRSQNIKIGSTTGYNNEMMSIVTARSETQGYKPDNIVCATDVPSGRPAPYMIYKNALELEIFPMSSIIKVGDTISDIREGLNAGTWSVGVIDSSNEMGLTLDEFNKLNESEIEEKRKSIAKKYFNAGAHYTINKLTDIKIVIEDINKKLINNIKP